MLYDDPARTPRPSMTLKNVPVDARGYRKAPFSMQNCRKSDSRRDHPDEERGTGIQLSRSEPHVSLESSYVHTADIPISPARMFSWWGKSAGTDEASGSRPSARHMLDSPHSTPIPKTYMTLTSQNLHGIHSSRAPRARPSRTAGAYG